MSVAKTNCFLSLALALCCGVANADIYRSLDTGRPVFTDVPPATGRYELFMKTPASVVQKQANALRAYAVDTRSPYASHIQAAALATNVEAALIRAVMAAESGYNPSAVSKAGAVGLMQLMPDTARRYNVKNRRDPAQSIHGGAQYLRDLLQMFNNDLRLTLAAYNAGEQAVMKYGNRIPPYRETVAYVPRVLKYYSQYRAGSAQPGGSGYKLASAVIQRKAAQGRVSKTYTGNPA
jgi:soluble lytic murein transglycosylase-like protein